ncbi:ABC transporter substrate-binding protein, partial [Acidobacteria bacterium AH-259-D05]|nr:ABC transporter substrate-binding protein [Acidobacteria bacterium AH-259-D05]
MKICSLIPSGTEIAFALGVGDQVVAVTEYCNYPPEARTKRVVSRGVIDIFRLSAREVDEKVQALAKAGKPAYQFDTQWLSKVKPDLILTQDMCHSCDLEAKEVFHAITGFKPEPEVLVLSPRRLADIFENIRRVAERAGVRQKAEEFIRELESRIERVGHLVSQASDRPRVLFLEWTHPPSPAGDWIPEQ